MLEWHFYTSKTKTFFDLVEPQKDGVKLVTFFNRYVDAKAYQEEFEIETSNDLFDFYKQQKNDIESMNGISGKEHFAEILPTKRRPKYKMKDDSQ